MERETKNNILRKLKKDWWIYLIIALLFLIAGIVISNNSRGNVAGEIRQLRQEERARSIRESFKEQQREEQRQWERTYDQMNPPRHYDWQD